MPKTRLVSPGAALLAATLTLVPGIGLGQQGAVRNGPLPGPLPLFPADSWWNVDVSQAPVDPRSAAFLTFVGLSKGLHPDFGGDAGPTEIYGMVYATVPGSQPLEPVAFDYADESDPGAPGRPPGYPIPIEAKTEPRWIEGGYPGNAGADGDKHLLVVDRDARVLFETWNTRCEPVGSPSCTWRAGSGAVFPLDSNLRRPDGWTSADAAGLAILPGLVRYDEATGPGPIRHALRFTVRSTNGYVFPASHRAGSTSGAPPLGTRLRLKAGKDLSGVPEPARKVLEAMKTYGLILADNGTDMYVQGAYDPRWDNDVLNPAFASVKVSDFEVVALGWQPQTADPCADGASGTGCGRWVLPSAARKPGAGGTLYRTDLTVANTGTSGGTVRLRFLGHDADGRSGPTVAVDLAGGRSATWPDVLGSAFGLADAYGAVEVRSTLPALAVQGQTWTEGAGGTFGQSVPGFADADLVRAGAVRSLLALREDDAFRTNLVLANATEKGIDVDLALVGADGGALGGRRIALPPLGMTQVARVVTDLGAPRGTSGARLLVSTPTAGGAFAVYGVVIDNVTGDPRTLLPR